QAAMRRSCDARGACRRVPTVLDDRLCVVAHAGMQHEQEFARRSVGAMYDEAPAAQIRFGADFSAMARDDALIVVAPGLGATGGDAARSFRPDGFPSA